MNLTQKVLVAMALGAGVGIAINLSALSQVEWVQTYLIDGLFALVGTMFITALKMLVVPLVLLSLISGVVGIGDVKALGKIGGKAFGLYLLTTALAITLAIALSVLGGIGEGASLQAQSDFSAKEAPPLTQVLSDIIPSNIFSAMAEGNMLQIIFFAILSGVAILMVGARAKALVEMIEIGNEVMMKMVLLVMATAPYAVFALLAKAFSELGLSLLIELIGYVAVVVLALLLHLFGILGLLLKLFTRLSVRMFFRKFRSVQLFAFSTSSSNATIPVTLQACTQRLGADKSVASFTVPFGATINMDGTAIMQGVATVFIANIYGIELGISEYATVVAMSVLASIGTAGVPGVGLVMLSMVFAQVGLPIEGIGLILGVDRLLDMLRTAVNVSGDGVVTCIVAKSEHRLDLSRYNDPDAGVVDETAVHIDDLQKSVLQKNP